MFSYASRRLAQQFRTLLFPRRSYSQIGTLCLPTEIILVIVSHLDDVSATCLALTCRFFYTICQPPNPPDAKTKQNLLLLLEKDLEDLYYCHECIQLHRWRSRWTGSLLRWYDDQSPCKRTHLVFLPGTLYTPYYYARLVMNRHFYGHAHGPPVAILADQDPPIHYPDGCVVSVAQQARVIDDQLTVRSTITMWHSKGDGTALRTHIDEMVHFACVHLSISRGRFVSGPVQIPELVDYTWDKCGLRVGDARGSCVICATDYNLAISWRERTGFRVQLQSYQRLGDCRSPLDWAWTSLSAACIKGEPRRESESMPGSVRLSWSGARDCAPADCGTWVDVGRINEARLMSADQCGFDFVTLGQGQDHIRVGP